jgi:hypothetical protein
MTMFITKNIWVLIYILSLSSCTNKMNNDECFYEEKVEEIFANLSVSGIDAVFDRDNHYQLQTSLAIIYKLNNGKLALVPNDLDINKKGLIINSQKCLDDMIANDYFPIENYEKTIYEYNMDVIKNFKNELPFFRTYLEQKFKKKIDVNDNKDLDISMSFLVKEKKRKSNIPLDYIAFGSIIGERIINENLGYRWILIKTYGTFNPYFRPVILTSSNKIIDIYEHLMSRINRNTLKIHDIFNSYGISHPFQDVKYIYNRDKVIYLD